MTSTAFLKGKSYCIAPHNDIAESLQGYLHTHLGEDRFAGYLDSGKDESPSLPLRDLDLILIISPNYYSEISGSLTREGVSPSRLHYALKGEVFFFTRSKTLYKTLLRLTHLKSLVMQPRYLQNRLGLLLAAKADLRLSTNEKGLAALRQRHHGRRAFIIGNGPSLQTQDLERLKDEITFAANKIYLAFDETDWRPTYYCVEDDLVLQQNYEAIEAYNDSMKLFANTLLNVAPRMAEAHYFELHKKPFYPGYPAMGEDPFEGFHWGSTVVYTMIQLAFYMGIREIYLLGVDFDFIIPDASREALSTIISEDEHNHFHKAYRRPGERWNVPNLHMQAHAFESAKAYCAENGLTIINLSRNSALEVFAKADFDTIKDQ